MRISIFLLVTATACYSQERSAVEFFEKQVRPILAERCYQCHSVASQPIMSELRLDTRDTAMKGGRRGPVIAPGHPETSRLIQAVAYSDPSLRMPPSAKLSDAEIAKLTEWIRMGAPWGAEQRVRTIKSSSFWAFQSPQRPGIPTVKRTGWPKNPIDNFILASLESKGLQPAPAADKRTLIRRATFDLTGLPPTPEEIRAFLADDSPQAFARVVERLLASPRYGERWGRHWLDVARYADSNGLDENLVFINAWRYRDYVIKAFNEDKPYSQFLMEQLAGDLLPETGNEEVNYERRIATGFLSLGGKMLAEDDPVKMEMDIVDEQVDTTARAFMALTFGCARCHDHKFDPISSADYYALAGIFRSTKTMDNFKVVAKWHEVVLAPKPERDRLQAHEDRIEAKRKELEGVTKPANEKLRKDAQARVADYLLTAADLLRRADLKLTHAAAAESSAVDHTFVTDQEFQFQAPQAGPHQLELHYTSPESWAMALYLNGVLVKSDAVSRAASKTWSVEGVFDLKAGTNTIKLVRPGRAPEVDKLLVSPWRSDAAQRPKTPEQAAAEAGLNAGFLGQWVAYLRRTKDDNTPLRDWQKAVSAGQPLEPLARDYQRRFLDADAASDPAGEQKALKEILHDKFGPFATPGNATRYYPADIAAGVKRIEQEIKDLEKAKPSYPQAMGVMDGKIADLRIHLRGNHLTLGDEVPRQFPKVLTGSTDTRVGGNESGRLQLATWLTKPDHPLTSRVMVNRIWRWHFGTGIVASTDNFGRLGEMPSNQALLDWLATQFVDRKWSIKDMHRLIMASNTYQMSAAHDAKAFETDPESKLRWRASRRRLEAEEIRDAVMFTGGLLDYQMGGTMLNFKDREYVTGTENRDKTDYDATRRAVYLPVIRSSLYDVFQAFDFGDPTVLNGDRPTTTVAPQALFMMNSTVVRKASRKMAESLISQTVDPNERVSLAYNRAFGRGPTGAESARAIDFIAKAEQAWQEREKDPAARALRAWQSLCRALLASNEFIYVE